LPPSSISVDVTSTTARERDSSKISVVVAAVASEGVADLLDGPLRRGRLLGSSGHAAWLEVDGEVVVIGDPVAVRLPNSIVASEGIGMLPDSSDPELWIGRGGLVVGHEQVIRVMRRWDPRPVLPAVDRLDVLRTIRGAAGDLGAIDDADLRAIEDADLGVALTTRNPGLVIGSASRLIGRGPGLTPEGDDLLAGALASYLLLSESLRHEPALRLVAAVSDLLIEIARSRTTSLAMSLLAHALVGEVADPVADLLRAIGGRGNVDLALERLRLVGHSSGPAYAAGVFTGAAAACGSRR
jgi:hypothetical protein